MAVPPNPLYATIILENRGQSQNVLGRVNFLSPQFGIASDTLTLRSNANGFSFLDALDGRPVILKREVIIPNPTDPLESILVISSPAAALPRAYFRTLNTLVEKVNAIRSNVRNLTIPASLKIETQDPEPKLPANIVIYNQGDTELLIISRNIFAYQFIAGQPNIIRFDLTNFPGCMVFVKNRFGTADLPVQLDIDDNGILTITGIPPDVEDPGFCTAMLMII